jgi:hypothetical protein
MESGGIEGVLKDYEVKFDDFRRKLDDYGQKLDDFSL